MNHLAWQEWNPRLQDYWRTWTHHYRHRVVEHVSKHTPLGGTVLEFGCSVGINLFLLKVKRPDVKVIGFDINPHARNYATLLTEDWGVEIRNTPYTSEQIPEADVVFSTFTLAYLDWPLLLEYLKAFRLKAKTLVLGEPTLFEDKAYKQEFTGLPCSGHVYPYPYLLKEMGMTVTVDEIEKMDVKAAVNAITIGVAT